MKSLIIYTGNVKWMKIIGDDSSAVIRNPIITTTSVIAMIVATTTLRLSKLDVTTGNIQVEKDLSTIYAGGILGESNLLLDSST